MHTRLKRAPKKLEPIRQSKEKGKKIKRRWVVHCIVFLIMPQRHYEVMAFRSQNSDRNFYEADIHYSRSDFFAFVVIFLDLNGIYVAD